MSEVLELRREVRELKNTVELLIGELKRKMPRVRWITTKQFFEATGMTRNELDGLRRARRKLLGTEEDDFTRNTPGIGLQIDWYKYKELYQ